MNNLDTVDKKLLTLLDENARIPISTLAKKVRTSRQVVEYRLQQLEKENILHYTALVDPTQFYENIWHVYLKIQSSTPQVEKELKEYLQKSKDVWWIAFGEGEWDVIFSICGDNITVFDEHLMKFRSLFHHHIAECQITTLVSVFVFPRTYFHMTPKKRKLYVKHENDKKIDSKDKKILSILTTNSRKPATKIGEEIHLSPRQVIQRIRRLEKEEIIRAYRLHLDTGSLGYEYYKINVYCQDFTTNLEKSMLSWCETNPYVIFYVRKIAPWTFELELETPDFKTINKSLKELRNTFGSMIRRMEITNITHEMKGELNFL